MKANTSAIIDKEDVRRTIFFFLKHWYFFVIFIAISVLAGLLYVHQETEIYAASISIILEPNQRYDMRATVLEGMGINPNYETISNEMRILRSHSIIEQAVNKLDLEVSYFIVGRLKTTEAYKGMPFEVEVVEINSGAYNLPIAIRIINENQYELSYSIEEKSYLERYFFGEEFETKLFTLIIHKNESRIKSILRSKLHIEELSYIFHVNNMAALINSYRGRVVAQNIDWSNVIEISFEDEVPERAVDFLDTLASVFIDHSLNARISINKNTVQFIDNQLSLVMGNLNDIETQLETFKQEESVIDLGKEELIYFNKLIEHEVKKKQLERQLTSLDFLYDYIGTSKDTSALPSSLMNLKEDQNLYDYLGRLFELQSSKKAALYDRSVNSPSIQRLTKQIKTLRAVIILYLKNSRAVLVEQVNFADSEVKKYDARLKSIPKTERGLVNIKRKVDINEDVYIYLLKKRSETLIARAGIVADKSVLDAGRSSGIVKPNQKKILYGSVGIGFILALLFIFIKSLFASKINTREDLAELTDIPILATVGRHKKIDSQYVVVDSDTQSPVTESFRTIRLKLEKMEPKDQSKVVLITSSSSSQGKSFCAVNTAAILAKAGRKVVLLDLDLHQPKLGGILNLTDERGLSSYLLNGDDSSELIHKTKIENFDVILAGPVPENPSELVLSKKIEKLITELKAKYDYIIVDTPPAGELTDALVIMDIADINLFLIRAKSAKRSYIDVAEQIKENIDPDNFYLILNSVKNNRKEYNLHY